MLSGTSIIHWWMVLPVLLLFLLVFFWFSLLNQVSFAVVVLQLLSVSVVFIIIKVL